jgi:hypothetical protein
MKSLSLVALVVLTLGVCRPSSAADTLGKGFTSQQDGTVTQLESGLMWQRDTDGTLRTLADASEYCRTLSVGDHSDWRLPDEQALLFSLWANVVSNKPAKDAFFPADKSSTGYWYSSPPGIQSYLTWPATGTVANEHTGYAKPSVEGDKRYTLCVRSAK